jgi:hypothetical protein
MNVRIGRVRIISEDTYQVMLAMLERLQSQNDSFCAEIEVNHKIAEASECLAPYENRLKNENDEYPLPHGYITMADPEFLERLNVRM